MGLLSKLFFWRKKKEVDSPPPLFAPRQGTQVGPAVPPRTTSGSGASLPQPRPPAMPATNVQPAIPKPPQPVMPPAGTLIQMMHKAQVGASDVFEVSKGELDDFKRKLDSIALNMAKVSAESEKQSRSNEQWVVNFSDRQKVLDVTAKLTIENDKVKLLETKVADSVVEIGNYQTSLTAQAERINLLDSQLITLRSSLDKMTLDRDETAKAKAAVDAAFADLSAVKEALEAERQAAVRRGDALATDLSNARGDCIAKADELRAIVAGINSRLAQFMPHGLLESKVANQVAAFDSSATAGDQASLRVMAGLSQLRAAFIPGSGLDDKLPAVKSIGLALYTAWSAQSKDPKSIHLLFVEWQNFLNDLPGAGYQLIVPDLGQSVPLNVTPLDGATKVNEVLLWIVKGGDGGIYSKGIVR